MKLTQYQVDAFAERVFEGNPAAVCPLDSWLADTTMQAIAAENNQAETAFFVPKSDAYHIRWFTPETEVKLCGHATLASAYVLFNELGCTQDALKFESLSGPLTVSRSGEQLVLDFPTQLPFACDEPKGLAEALGVTIIECLKNEDYVVVLDNETQVRSVAPDFAKLKRVEARGVIVTARSEKYDFVNRFFGPRVGVDEDSVTGSAFTKIIPYWANELGKNKLFAKQVSKRGGEVACEYLGERVKIAGKGTLFSKSEIYVSD